MCRVGQVATVSVRFGRSHLASSTSSREMLGPLLFLYAVAAAEPLFGRPFTPVWNAPSRPCQKFGVDFDLSAYGIVANRGQRFPGGDKMVIFYESSLGLYPSFDANGTAVNGGLPQTDDFQAHFAKAYDDILSYIPDDAFRGLAVIDWESWRPIFERNFDKKKIYIDKSEAIVAAQHPDWTHGQVAAEAKRSFEMAARFLMEGTLKEAQHLRREGKWGFYGFPRCYNFYPDETYCANSTMLQNDRLSWLFSASTGLYPSIYLRKGFPDRAKFVQDTLKETYRVLSRFVHNASMVIPYTRYRYSDTQEFYDEDDLRITISQSALLGTAGVVIWDSAENFKDKESCFTLQKYLTTTLGPLIKDLSDFCIQCSQQLCNGHGRCIISTILVKTTVVEKIIFNFLNKLEYSEKHIGDSMLSFQRDVSEKSYNCHCYTGWQGEHCDVRFP